MVTYTREKLFYVLRLLEETQEKIKKDRRDVTEVFVDEFYFLPRTGKGRRRDEELKGET